MTPLSTTDPQLRAAVRRGMRALRRLTEYRLPERLDHQMLEWGERKESLSPAEHDQLMALVDFSHERTIDKLQAEVALKELEAFFPEEAA